MHTWHVNFQTYRPMASLPRLLVIARERQTTPAYRHEGRFRASERHCIFKYTLSGVGVFRRGQELWRVEPGSGFLCRINDPDTAYFYPDDGREPWHFVYACFAGPTATAMVDELVDRYGPIFAPPRDRGGIAQLLGWESYAGTQPTVSRAEKARIVLELLTDLASAKETSSPPSPANQLARRAQQIVSRNLQSNLNVSELAESLDVSREHLTRVFKEQTGQTPYQYLLRQRMLLACHLLKETELTTKQVAARLGYTQPAQFSRCFRRVMLLTPTRFREVGIIPVS
jgi:AraC-like DNA-binding protein